MGYALGRMIHTLFSMVITVIMFSIKYVLGQKIQLSIKASWRGYEALVHTL